MYLLFGRTQYLRNSFLSLSLLGVFMAYYLSLNRVINLKWGIL